MYMVSGGTYMAERQRIRKGRAQVRPAPSFDDEHLPKPGDKSKTVFSLRLDDDMVKRIDRARDVYAERIAAAVKRPTVPRESRSSMIRILLEDGLRFHGVDEAPDQGATKEATK
jgi:hypothetical protein